MLLLVLMFLGMTLETLGVGLVIPATAVLTQSDLASNYPALGNPDKQLLVGVYFIKALLKLS